MCVSVCKSMPVNWDAEVVVHAKVDANKPQQCGACGIVLLLFFFNLQVPNKSDSEKQVTLVPEELSEMFTL